MPSVKNISVFCVWWLLLCISSVAVSEEHSDNASGWVVSKDKGIVRYVTNGEVIYGHQFGFFKKAPRCEMDILWISWSSVQEEVKKYVGTDAKIKFETASTKFELDVPLLTVLPGSESMLSITLMVFTNFVAGEKFFKALEGEGRLQVGITGPDRLVNLLDVRTDYFTLPGFLKARNKAEMLCKSRD